MTPDVKSSLVAFPTAILLVLCVHGCTIVPKAVPVAKAPALHGNVANAGVLEVTAAGVHVDGADHALYNALITLPDGHGRTLGAHFLPALVPNAGVSRINPNDGSCWLDKEHASDFGQMLNWRENPAQLPP